MKKKYIVIIVILVILVIGIVLAYNYSRPSTSEETSKDKVIEWETYESQEYGFKVNYPSDWEKLDDLDKPVAVAFLSPVKSGDIFAENINIIAMDLSEFGIESLEEYVALGLEDLEKTVEDFNLYEMTDIKLGEISAKRGVYTGTQKNTSLQWMQVLALKDNYSYIITFSANIEDYPDFIQTVDEVVASFKFVQ